MKFEEYFNKTYSSLSRREKVQFLKENTEKPIHLSIFNDEVRKAFDDFIADIEGDNWAIAGGIAYGSYCIPRSTQDLDILTSGNIINDNLKKHFKQNRTSSFEHKKSGVEVELLNSENIDVPKELIDQAIKTARIDNINGKSVRIVNLKYLIALKLQRPSKFTDPKSMQDLTDIAQIIQTYGTIDLSNIGLTEQQLKIYDDLLKKLGVKI